MKTNRTVLNISPALFILLFLCCSLIFIVEKGHCINKTSEKKISIELNYAPKGDMSSILNDDNLSRLLPELKHPRVFNFDDLDSKDEIKLAKELGESFVLQGDFNKDGNTELAFIAKDLGAASPKKAACFVIVSIKGEKVTREYLKTLAGFQKAFISIVQHYVSSIDNRVISDAIGISYKLETDWCSIVYWNGKKFEGEACENP